MAKTGHNGAGKNENNYRGLVEFVGALSIGNNCSEVNYNKDRIIFIADNNNQMLGIGMNTGNFYRVDGEGNIVPGNDGKNKANKRAYEDFALPHNEEFMIANYVAMALVAPLHEDIKISCMLGMEWRESALGNMNKLDLNHANGDTTVNTYDNLEATEYNAAHARLMAELEYAWPGKYTEIFYIENDGKKHYRFKNGNKVYGTQIRRFNEVHTSIQIKAYKDKEGRFTPGLNKAQLEIIATELHLKEAE